MFFVLLFASCEKDKPGSGSKEIKKETVNFFEVNGDTSVIDKAYFFFGFKQEYNDTTTEYTYNCMFAEKGIDVLKDSNDFIAFQGNGNIFLIQICSINEKININDSIYCNEAESDIYFSAGCIYIDCSENVNCSHWKRYDMTTGKFWSYYNKEYYIFSDWEGNYSDSLQINDPISTGNHITSFYAGELLDTNDLNKGHKNKKSLKNCISLNDLLYSLKYE